MGSRRAVQWCDQTCYGVCMLFDCVLPELSITVSEGAVGFSDNVMPSHLYRDHRGISYG